MPETKVKYNHAEAFCLMQYGCQKCKKFETLWNSRDGVTPFMITCQHCGGSMSHINWQFDECIPDFNPPAGTRIFIDLTMDRAKECAIKRIEAVRKQCPELEEPDPDELAESIYNGGIEPDIITITIGGKSHE